MLLDVANVRAQARSLHIARIDAGPAAIALTMRYGKSVDAAAAGLTEKDGRFLLHEQLDDATRRVERMRELLDQL